MTYRIVIEPSAARGIREGVRWLAENHSAHVAAHWLNGIERAIDALKTSPERWPLAAESEKFPVDVREFLQGRGKRGKYRILYTVADDAVHILYVRHSAQDEVEL